MNELSLNAPEDPVDLTNCDREPIHQLGRVQSFGTLIAFSSDWIVNHAAANVAEFLGWHARDIIGLPAHQLFTDQALKSIRGRTQMLSDDSIDRIFGVQLIDSHRTFDVAVHMVGRTIIVEIERHQQRDERNYVSLIRPMISRISSTKDIDGAAALAARQLRAFSGFDRVMVYKFLPDGAGQVIAESRETGVDSFMGLHYPGTDIPKQARKLYLRNILRIISDVDDEGAIIEPQRDPNGEPLDLTLSTLRSVSPIHVEYLKNMGVHASMSVSIIVRGELWGLFACHHYKPMTVDFEKRSAMELFGQMFSFVIDQKISDQNRAEINRARSMHDQLMSRLADGSTISEIFADIADVIGQTIPCDGVAAWTEGEFLSAGKTPTREEFKPLVRFLNTASAGTIYATDSISSVYPDGEDFGQRAAGMLALPISRTPRDYLVLFRQEFARSVQWAGNPNKPVELGPNGSRLTPRKSFETWKQDVHNTSRPWTEAELSAANAIRVTLLEVVLRMNDMVIQDRERAQSRQELLIAELNHRVRNILNLVRGLVNQSGQSVKSIEEFSETIGGRIQALARAHDQITQENWEPASLHALIRTEFEAYLETKIKRVLITGPDALLHPTAYACVALVVHELVTNSAKYGALSDSRGRVEIETSQEDSDDLSIQWREVGGPPISSMPDRRGFGSTIIERSIPFELKGQAKVNYETTGLNARFVIPSQHIHGFSGNGSAKPEAAIAKPGGEGSEIKGKALIVEDNMIIALDAEDMLREIGLSAVHTAPSVESAFRLLDEHDFDMALLDVNLGSETSEPVADRLQEAGIPFAFATGYGDSNEMNGKFAGVPTIKKPYDQVSIRQAFTDLAESK